MFYFDYDCTDQMTFFKMAKRILQNPMVPKKKKKKHIHWSSFFHIIDYCGEHV